MAQGRFIALERALQAATACLTLTRKSRCLPGDLASQLTRAASSVPLNLAEGSGRTGRDRIYHYRIAYASAKEASTAIKILLSANAIDASGASPALDLLDQVRAMTWRLTMSRT